MPVRRPTPLTVTPLEDRVVAAGDLVYALQLGGLASSSFVRVAADTVGNTYVTGNFTGSVDMDPRPAVTTKVTSNGGTDVFVAKYGYSGQLLWAKTLGGAANDVVADIAFDGAGNSYLTGTFTGQVDFDPSAASAGFLTSAAGGATYLWKLSNAGALVYANSVAGRSTATSLAVDAGGNLALTGRYFGTADFNPDGNGTFNLTTTNPTGAGYIWKLNQTGSFKWAKAIQSAGGVALNAVALDGAGNVVVGGRFTGVTDFDPGTATFNINGGSFWTPGVVKLGTTGQFLWAKAAAVATGAADAVNSIAGVQLDSQGNVYAAGSFAGALDFDPGAAVTTLTSAGGTDGFAWKLNSAGGLLYADRFGTAADDKVTDLATDQAGSAYVAGQFTGSGDFDPGTGVTTLYAGTKANTFLLKLTPAGALGFARTLGNGNGTTNATGLWADGAGNAYAAGTFSGTVDFDPSASTGALTGAAAGAGFIAKIYTPATASVKPPNSTPINVSAGGPYSVSEGAGLKPTATATDPDGNALTYTWDLNGDNVYGDAVGKSPTLTAAQMTALGLGNSRTAPWAVRVKVSDGVNIPVVAATTLTVTNAPPKATFSPVVSTAFEGIGTVVKFTKVTDASAVDAKAGFRYSYDFNNDGKFDVGNGTTYAGSLPNSQWVVRNKFAESGVRTVIGRVFDKDGGFREYAVQINFLNVPPTGLLSATGVRSVGNAITFRFTNVKDPSPGDTAAGFQYAIDWEGIGNFYSQAGPTSTHVYQTPGTYHVRGLITDRDGGFREIKLTLVIS